MTPAQLVIQTFGGVRATARALDRDPSAVSRWQSNILRQRKTGAVPQELHKKILRLAPEISADELIHGRPGRKR